MSQYPFTLNSQSSTTVFTFANTSLRDTTATSQDGSTTYILETPKTGWCRDTNTPTRILKRSGDGQPEWLSTVKWASFSSDKISFAWRDPERLKDYMPQKGFFTRYRTFPTVTGEWRWKGDHNYELFDASGKVVARYKKRSKLTALKPSEFPTLEVNAEAASVMDEVVIGLVVAHHDMVVTREAIAASSS